LRPFPTKGDSGFLPSQQRSVRGIDGTLSGLRLDKSFRSIVKACGFCDVVIHTLRHTAITWGLQNGMDLWDASGYFGVSVEVLDRVYGHHSPHHLRQAASIMGRRPKPIDGSVQR
jgi:integrase